jgi:NDP-sugar pyrophosphorylase family protein
VRAVILAGGAGTRLWPLTRSRPAALLPIANRPVVEHVLEALVRHGVDAVTVALHHCPYPLEAQLGDGTRLGVRIRYALERVPLGTAGCLRRVAGGWREPFVVAAGTAVAAVDLSKVAALHQARGWALTLVVRPAPAGDGAVELGDADEVSVAPRPRTGPFALTGLAVVSPGALALAPASGRPVDLVGDLLPRLREAGLRVGGYVTSGPALTIRTVADLLEANRRAVAGELPGLVLPGVEVEPGIRICRGARVHPEARLVPPVLVGRNAVIDRGAVVGGSVVGDDVIVDPGSGIRDSVVLPRTHVGGGLRLERAVVSPEGVGRAQPTTWVDVQDPRILGDTYAPGPVGGSGALGRLAAALVVGLTAPVWLPALLALAIETRGRLFCKRRIVGARGREAALRSLAVRGRCGRTVSRLGWKRLPYVWSVLSGDLHWVGTTPRTPQEIGALRARGEPEPAPPGLVTLPQFAPARLRREGRLALDRLYSETRSRRMDLRLLRAAALVRTRPRLEARPPAILS